MRNLLNILRTVLVCLLPFLAGALIGRYSPYFEGNSLGIYIAVCFAYCFLSAFVLYITINRALPKKVLLGGILLFFIGTGIASIIGLAVPPDISPNMLQHPEREHFRYLLLFLSLLLFATSFVIILKEKWNVLSKRNKWIIVAFILAFAEMCWEFYHHYHYAENLKFWIERGKDANAFIKDYDNITIARFGAIGRFFQYAVVAWLGYALVRFRHIRYWSFVPILMLCTIGIAAAMIVFYKGMPLPQNLQIFMLFFIPGFPFILLYWIGVILLNKPIIK